MSATFVCDFVVAQIALSYSNHNKIGHRTTGVDTPKSTTYRRHDLTSLLLPCVRFLWGYPGSNTLPSKRSAPVGVITVVIDDALHADIKNRNIPISRTVRVALQRAVAVDGAKDMGLNSDDIAGKPTWLIPYIPFMTPHDMPVIDDLDPPRSFTLDFVGKQLTAGYDEGFLWQCFATAGGQFVVFNTISETPIKMTYRVWPNMPDFRRTATNYVLDRVDYVMANRLHID